MGNAKRIIMTILFAAANIYALIESSEALVGLAASLINGDDSEDE